MDLVIRFVPGRLSRKQLSDPSFLRPDGLPVEGQPAVARSARRIGVFRGQLRDGSAPARWPAHRPDGRSPDDGWLSAYRACGHGAPAQPGAASPFRCDPVQADGYGDGRTTAHQPAEGTAYPAAILPGSLKRDGVLKYIDLNGDMGEGMATDAALFPFISSANIACGAHAGDDDTMRRTI